MKIQQTLFQRTDLLNAEKYAAHKSMAVWQRCSHMMNENDDFMEKTQKPFS